MLTIRIFQVFTVSIVLILLGFLQIFEFLQKSLSQINSLHSDISYADSTEELFNSTEHAQSFPKFSNQTCYASSPVFESKNNWIADSQAFIGINPRPESFSSIGVVLAAIDSLNTQYEVPSWGLIVISLSNFLIMLLLIMALQRCSAAVATFRASEQRYKDLAEAGADIFWEIDVEFRLTHLSDTSSDQLSRPLQKFLGKPYQEILLRFPNIKFDGANFESLVTARQQIKDFVFQLKESNGQIRSFKLNGRPIFDQHQNFTGYRGIQHEVTDEYNLVQNLSYQTAHDSLTGLINRNEFNTRLQNTVIRARQFGNNSVLCYLDLDQFKIVNDTAGHLVGDQLLSDIADLLKQSIRSDDHLGRLGGDEFGLIIENCSLDKGKQVCQRLIDKVHEYRFNWQGRQFDVGVSIGMVPITPENAVTTELLSRADLACYKAKDLGRGRICISTCNDFELETRQTQMSRIANISQAIEENRLFLMQQPIQAISQPGNYAHIEILLRMKDEEGHMISPGQFIPIAERYGMIELVDRWVVERVVSQYNRLFPQSKPIVSINLSGASLSDDRFLEFVLRLIRKSNLTPECLCFEITETAAISHLEQVQTFIKELKAIGVKFALDDFGSGLSSFGYLRNLPVDYLKIDGGLVRHINDEEYDRSIVEMINQVAHMMQMHTIAEFVEDDAILNHLKILGVDYAQGYWIGKPIPVIADV